MVKPYILPALLACCLHTLLCFTTAAQGKLPPPVFFKPGLPAPPTVLQMIDGGSYSYHFVRFTTLPGSIERKKLSLRGIDLLDYIPQNTYLARIRGKWMPSALSALGITGSLPLDSSFKRAALDTTGFGGRYRVLRMGNDGRKALREQVLTKKEIEQTVADKDVLYIAPAIAMQVLTDDPAEVLQADRVHLGWEGQAGLDGAGVVVGVGDNGLAYHVDLHYNEAGMGNDGALHATHVSGAIAGGGYVNPRYKGFAPGATLVNELFDYILARTPEYYRDRGMVVTNNSYGAGSKCYPVSGQYSIYCAELDRLALEYPEVIHVFAAGNGGVTQCAPFPMAYKTIDNAYQAAKNVLTVAASDDNEINYYSRGPAMDGRLKPEITAIGSAVTSTAPGNTYIAQNGTSQASPQVAGAMALLYQHYRQLNGGKNPPADLMKAVVCNTATDIGRKGVDFEFGFGWINPADAIDLLTKKYYFNGSVGHGETQQFQVALPQQAHNLRFLLYWADQPASLYSSVNLVNDLDIIVKFPDGTEHKPMVLDTSAAGVLVLATEGEDHLNNIEQVQADQAPAGMYTITVRGHAVPFGPQSFQLVYYYHEAGLRLLQPVGGEAWKAGEGRRALWRYPGHAGAPLDIAFSADNGATWASLGTTRDQAGKQAIAVPAATTTHALVRITDAANGATAVSAPFTVLPDISFSLDNVCADTIRLRWTRPPGVDSVLLYLYDTGYLAPRGFYADTIIYITGSRQRLAQWISLAPVKDGMTGERALAQTIIPGTNPCIGSVNGDIALRAILLPPNTREGSTTAPVENQKISYIIENKSNVIFSDSLYTDVSVDGGSWIREAVYVSLPPFGADTIEALATIPALAIGEHPVQVVIHANGDTNNRNDSLSTGWTYLPNPPLQIPYADHFSTLPRNVYGNPGRFGLAGATNWDFSTASTSLKLVTGAGDSAGLYSSSRMRYQTYQLMATYNLSSYQLTDNLYLDLNLPSLDYTQLTLEIRGADNLGWITIPATQVKRFGGNHLNIGFYLAVYGQQFSASTQLRLRFTDNSVREQLALLTGVKWYSVPNDVSVNTFISGAVNLLPGDTLGVRAIVQNQSLTTQYNIPVSFRSGGVELARVIIDSLPPLYYGDTIVYLLTTGFVSGPQPVYAIADMANDALRANDTASIMITAYTRITGFPYYESFEKGRSGWYNTRLFQLSDSVDASLPVFAAANGKTYWRPMPAYRDALGYDAVFDGYLYSPAFDTKNMTRPMLSMSINQQLCDGKDSVIVQASPDNGSTWIRLDAKTDATHFYDSASRGAFMAVCDTADWQVVTVPLPMWNRPTVVRIASNARENRNATVLPKLSAGLLADDMHVYDLQQLAETKPVRELPSAAYNGHIVLPRLWLVNAGEQPAKLRLFFTHEEWRSWPGRQRCDTCRLQGNPYRLSVFRYSAPQGVDSTDANNLPGFETEITADSFNLVPFRNGYFAEVDQPLAGEYYIGLPGAGADLQFTAKKEAAADAVTLNWSVADTRGIKGYAVERSVRTDDKEGPFVELAYQQPQATTGYRYRDDRVAPPAAYRYRIRIDYGNGLSVYSYIETVSFEESIRASLYPNPWQGGALHLFLQNTEGRRVELQLFDLLGRRLWMKSFDAPTRRQALAVEEAVKGRPAGVYVLKVNAMGQKTSFRLVVSGK